MTQSGHPEPRERRRQATSSPAGRPELHLAQVLVMLTKEFSRRRSVLGEKHLFCLRFAWFSSALSLRRQRMAPLFAQNSAWSLVAKIETGPRSALSAGSAAN
jgi:hypothetical protein